MTRQRTAALEDESAILLAIASVCGLVVLNLAYVFAGFDEGGLLGRFVHNDDWQTRL